MKAAALVVLAFLQVSCVDTKQIFSIKEGYSRDEIKAIHKKVAVLPVNYVAKSDSQNRLEKMMENNTDPLARQEEKAYKFQHMIYEELYRANPNTNWLDDKVTNQLLKEKNISFQEIRNLSKSEIAKVLQVDAVIYCDFFFKTETISKADASRIVSANQNDTKNVVEFTVEIYSALEDDLIWKGTSTVNRQKIYSPVLFREIISRQLEPILPFD